MLGNVPHSVYSYFGFPLQIIFVHVTHVLIYFTFQLFFSRLLSSFLNYVLYFHFVYVIAFSFGFLLLNALSSFQYFLQQWTNWPGNCLSATSLWPMIVGRRVLVVRCTLTTIFTKKLVICWFKFSIRVTDRGINDAQYCAATAFFGIYSMALRTGWWPSTRIVLSVWKLWQRRVLCKTLMTRSC